MNWGELVKSSNAKELEGTINLPEAFTDNWTTNQADRELSWVLYSELRTRVAVQPMHYMHGDEASALQSLVDFFRLARDCVREKGPEARSTSTLVTFVLNRVLRPFTAEWHKRSFAGELNREDVRHLFRERFLAVQKLLRQLATILGHISEKDAFCSGTESWTDELPNATNSNEDVDANAKAIPFTILLDERVTLVVRERIKRSEEGAIRTRRIAVNKFLNEPYVETDRPITNVAGLAISGGGIRSATFGLGVVQQLVQQKIMPHFDYISTVSGGGYLGSFLSSYLNSRDSVGEVSLAHDKLPFKKIAVGETAPIRHLRAHSKYLLNGGLKNTLSMVLLAVYGFVASGVIFLPVIAGLLLSISLYSKPRLRKCVDGVYTSFFDFIQEDNELCWSLGIAFIAIISLAPVGAFCRWTKVSRFYKCWENAMAFLVPIALLFAMWRTFPYLLVMTSHYTDSSKGITRWILPTTATLSGVIMFLQRTLAGLNATQLMTKAQRIIGLIVLALFGPLLLIATFLTLGQLLVVSPMPNGGEPNYHWLYGLTFGPLLIGFFFLDINRSSLHPFYRWKLSEAYLIDRKKPDTRGQEPAPANRESPKQGSRSQKASVFRNWLTALRSPSSLLRKQPNTIEAVAHCDDQLLSKMREHNSAGPYHLINSALNVPASDEGPVRGRGTDFFLFSQRYCGSALTGYYRTKYWEKMDPNLNLGTAMAISAAAASPVTGVVQLPVKKSLLAMFNVRLDYWIPVPCRKDIPVLWWAPGPWYLLRQVVGWMDHLSSFVNLSDGGHIENLGLYELLRRRCRYIVVIDGECDPKLQCGALMQAKRFAQLDFGIEINIDMTRFQTTNDGSAKFHFTYGTIKYPRDGEPATEDKAIPDGEAAKDGVPAKEGTANKDTANDPYVGQILYIKLSRTGNEPPGVEHFRLKHPDFPHQSTADQFFDESQFEAYRALGEHIAGDLFSSELLGDNTPTESIKAWFDKLSNALNDPNHK